MGEHDDNLASGIVPPEEGAQTAPAAEPAGSAQPAASLEPGDGCGAGDKLGAADARAAREGAASASEPAPAPEPVGVAPTGPAAGPHAAPASGSRPTIPPFLLPHALPAPPAPASRPAHRALLGPSLADISAATGGPAAMGDLVGAGHPARAAREGLRVPSAAGEKHAQGEKDAEDAGEDAPATADAPGSASPAVPAASAAAEVPASAPSARMTAGKRVGWFLLFLSVPVVFTGLQVVGVLLANALGGLALAAGARELASSLFQSLAVSLFLGQALLVLVGLPWWRHIERRHRKRSARRPLPPSNALGIAALGVGFQLVLSVLLTVVLPLLPALQESYQSTVSAGDLNDLALIPLAATAIGAPVAEELFCRGLGLTFAQKATGRFWAANVLQALMFGVLHGNLVQGSYAFVSALVLGMVYRRYGRIGPCIALHFALNASSYLVAVLPLSLAGMAAVGAVLMVVGWVFAGLPLPLSLLRRRRPSKDDAAKAA